MKMIVFPGDGIGPEITDATLGVLTAANQSFDLGLDFEQHEIGVARLARDGATFTDELVEAARAADGILLGPADTEAYPPATEGGINPSSTLRTRLELYANLRPSRTWPGVPSLTPEMDLLVARENTEGFYADRNMAVGSGEFAPTEDVALAVRKITAAGSRRLLVTAFEQARKRRKKITIVSKVNVLKITDGLWLREAEAVAKDYPDVAVERQLVDAMASLIIRDPAQFDVIAATNMFGDILSNEAAEMSGGLGLAGSLNAGDKNAMAQASHGSAPEIAGRDVANPVALILSAAMLLDWMGDRHGQATCNTAATRIVEALSDQLAAPDGRTADLGGATGTKAFGAAIAERVSAAE